MASTTKSALTLDMTDNPELQQLLGDAKPGDRGTLTISYMVTANHDNSFECDIENIEVEGEETEGGEAEVSPEEPVMAVIVSKAKRPAKEMSGETDATEEDATEE